MKLPARFLEPAEDSRSVAGPATITHAPINPTYNCIYPGGAIEVVTRRGELEEVAPPAIRRDLSPALLAAIHSAPYGEFHLTNTKAS